MSEFEGWNIFTDLHHGDLYYSLHLLFEKRLKCKLYRPIGLEWYHAGYWKIADPYPDPLDTARQYLDYNGSGIVNPFNKEFFVNKNIKVEDNVFYCYDETRDYCNKAVTFEQFKKMKFDIIMSTVNWHDGPYADLIKKYQPQAKHIAQIGNSFWGAPDVHNVMYSLWPSAAPEFKPDQNVVYYTQEFDLATFKYVPPINDKLITNFIARAFTKPGVFSEYRQRMPEFTFKSYGMGNEDGMLNLKPMAEVMRKSMFAWNIKPFAVPPGGGHTFNNWCSVGRPIITEIKGEKGMLKEGKTELVPTLIPGETCIDLNERTRDQNIQLIREWTAPDMHRKVCERMHELSKKYLDFDSDEKKIRDFMGRLK